MKALLRTLIGLVLGTSFALAPAAAFGQTKPHAPRPGEKGWVSPDPLPPDTPYVVCFAEGTDPAYVEAVNAYVAMRNQAFFGQNFLNTGRWSGAIGTPRTITWSFVPDGLSIPGGGVSGELTAPSNLFATLDSAIGRTTWVLRFQQVFDRWHALTGITYTRIQASGVDWDDGAAWGSAGSATHGDVRISMHNIDGASNVLAYNQFPSNGDMVLDSGDAGNWASSGNLHRFLRNCVAHEHGHGIGLLHTCPTSQTKLMEPFISTAYDGPRQDDMRGGQYLYGDPFENNASAATAWNLGNLVIGTPINLGATPNPISGASDVNSSILAIGTGDQDYFKFTTSAGLIATVTATPVGSTYVAVTQSSNCNETTPTQDTHAAGNLKVEVLGTNGTTVVASSDTTAAGAVETLSGVLLSSPGTYYARISCSSMAGVLQEYKLTVSGSATSACPSFSVHPISQPACNNASVTLTATADGLPIPTLQWRRNGVPLSNGGNISGVTTGSLTINPVHFTDQATYDCVATNSCGPVASNPADLTVLGQISITQQPLSQAVPLGQPVTLTVVANNAVLYQWYKDSQLLNGETTSTYQISSFSASDVGFYNCLTSSNCSLLRSDDAQLTIGTACYPNCDGSTSPPILNVNDFACFLNLFAAGDPYANCDGSTADPVLNVLDFACFLNAFASGCP